MSKAAEFAVILKMNPMFADLGADELQRIASLCHTRHLGAGEALFRKGDPGEALFGVRRGQIRIETGASDGSRLTLNFMGPGDLFGEVAVLDGQSRAADATAGEPTELFVLRRQEFLEHLEPGWREGSARSPPIPALKYTSRRSGSASSSVPRAKASTASCSSGARTAFWTCSAAGFYC